MVSFSVQLRGIFHPISSLITMLLLPLLACRGCTRWSLPAVALSQCEKPSQGEGAGEGGCCGCVPIELGLRRTRGRCLCLLCAITHPGNQWQPRPCKASIQDLHSHDPIFVLWDKCCFLLVFLLLLFQRQLKRKWFSFSNVVLIHTSIEKHSNNKRCWDFICWKWPILNISKNKMHINWLSWML